MSAERYIKAALDGVCAEVREMKPGEQAKKLYDSAYRISRLVLERELDPIFLQTVEVKLVESGLQMLNSPNREAWTEEAIRRQVSNGIRDAGASGGTENPPEGCQKAVQRQYSGSIPDLPVQLGELRRYSYCVDGVPVMIKVRFAGDPKFRPFYHDVRSNGVSFWNSHKPVCFQYVPYRLDVLKASQGSTVYYCEGERDAESLIENGLCATTFGSAGVWPAGAEMYFTGRDVVVIGDNDDAGHRHITTITEKLTGVAQSVRSWTPIGGPPGYDVTDWLRDHPGADIVQAIIGEQELRSTSNVVALVTGVTAQVQVGSEVAVSVPVPIKTASRFRPHRITADDSFGSQEYVVDGVLPLRGYALLVGASGLGKSFIGVDLALAVKNGLAWGGRDVRQGEVVYIAAEDPCGLHSRASAQLLASDGRLQGFHIIKDPPDLSRGSADTDEIIVAIKDALAGRGPALIIIDTFQRIAGGVDENSASEVMGVVGNIEKVSRAFDCLVVMVHHVGKSSTASGPRGSSVFKDAADAVIEVKKSRGELILHLDKLRNGPSGIEATFELEASPGNDGCRVRFLSDWRNAKSTSANKLPDEGQPRKIKTAIIEVLREKQAAAGQLGMVKKELRHHRSILSCLAHYKNPKSAGDVFSRAVRELERSGVIAITGQLVMLAGDATPDSDMSPTVGTLSPIAA